MSIHVLDPGALTTVQDLGRPGHGALGVAPSGALDRWSLRTANRLVGNEDDVAGLEITMRGPTLAFESDAVVAIAGSPFELSLLVGLAGSSFERDVDSHPAPHGTAFRVRAGESVRTGRGLGGARAYMAIRGGIDVPLVLGSRSTQLSAGIGGFGGRALIAGDALPSGKVVRDVPLRRSEGPTKRPETVRVLPGPQEEAFTPEGIRTFYSERYHVSTRTDRTGMRLEGPAISLAREADIDPEGVVTGSIQIPGDGLPIILANDRPATGGYAKIATVIEADMAALAHAKPGDTLRFVRCTREEARAAYQEKDRLLDLIVDLA
jgi:antagonist of KipI